MSPWACLAINLAATPGAGTLLARRYIAGAAQLALALAGFALAMGWIFQKIRVYYSIMFDTQMPPEPGNALGILGLALFGVAWLWSLVSSILIIRTAEKPVPPPLPPQHLGQ